MSASSSAPRVGPKWALRFTGDESERASQVWGANCGPHSLSAASGKTLEEIRPALGVFRGWMNPTMMTAALINLNISHRLAKGLKTTALCEGINRVQWEGSWLNPGVPVAAAYHHTHWIAHSNGFVLCTATCSDMWLPVARWAEYLAAEKKPWHVTHHYILSNGAGG